LDMPAIHEKINLKAVSRYPACLLLAWTVIVVLSGAWNIYQNRGDSLAKATLEARTYFYLNLSYRKWGAALGGVYAAADKVEPNPYLIVPHRDIQTTDGRRLTLVNPAYMTRMVFDIVKKESDPPVISKITSIKYFNPSNAPDTWEQHALQAFEKGGKEASEVIALNGNPYLRVIRPLIAESNCLTCHGSQGYKRGDIRGGISIAVPLGPYYASEIKTRNIILLTHMLLWLVVSGGIIFLSRNLQGKQKKLAESEWKFRTLSEFSNDWDFWITEGNRIAFMSPSCTEITGYTQEEFFADPELIVRIIHPEDRQAWRLHLEHFRAVQHEEMELRIFTKGGQVKWLSHVCGPIFIGNEFLGRRANNRDITDRKKLEEQLLQSQKMESLGILAGGVAHDFNNMLTAVMGYSSLLEHDESLSEKARIYVSNMVSVSERARTLTASLLAFSRKQIIQPSTINLNSALERIAKLLKRLIGEDIELRIKYAAVERSVFADPHQIEQALMNLATNARDAMPDGGVLSIETSLCRLEAGTALQYNTQPGDYMVLSVSDTGSGIDKNDLPHIFEPFFTTKEKGKGTGLGLSMVYGTIRQQGGFITTYSEKGGGATFRIYLPVADREGSGPEAPGEGVAEIDFRGSETLLVGEDDEAVRGLLKDVLEYYGYSVVLAADGEEAVRSYAQNRDRVAMVILDVMMPKMNGRAAYEAIKAMSPDVKTLFISGYTQDILTSRGICEEGLEFVAKPVQVRVLMTKIRCMLGAGGK